MKNNIPEMTHLMEQNQQKHCNMLTIQYLMVYGATFNNISVISWRSVLMVEESEIPRENHRPVASH